MFGDLTTEGKACKYYDRTYAPLGVFEQLNQSPVYGREQPPAHTNPANLLTRLETLEKEVAEIKTLLSTTE